MRQLSIILLLVSAIGKASGSDGSSNKNWTKDSEYCELATTTLFYKISGTQKLLIRRVYVRSEVKINVEYEGEISGERITGKAVIIEDGRVIDFVVRSFKKNGERSVNRPYNDFSLRDLAESLLRKKGERPSFDSGETILRKESDRLTEFKTKPSDDFISASEDLAQRFRNAGYESRPEYKKYMEALKRLPTLPKEKPYAGKPFILDL